MKKLFTIKESARILVGLFDRMNGDTNCVKLQVPEMCMVLGRKRIGKKKILEFITELRKTFGLNLVIINSDFYVFSDDLIKAGNLVGADNVHDTIVNILRSRHF